MTRAHDLPSLEQLPDASAAMAGDARGDLLVTTGEREAAARAASHTAATLRELRELGASNALGALDCLVVKGGTRTTVTVVRAELFVQATLDPAQGTLQVERALGEWQPGARGSAADGAKAGAGPAGEVRGSFVAAADPASSLSEAVAGAAPPTEPWTLLRRTLVRGQLTDASALRDALGAELPEGAPAAGAEPLDAVQRDRGMDALLEGIGSVLSGDALGGLRILEEVAAEAQPNRSFRWLAAHWSTLGAVQCSNLPAARRFARQAALLARELDAEAKAVSYWAGAEVLRAEGDKDGAVDWIAQARVRFEQLGDGWGLGRACFAEARILGAMEREEEAAEAARRAWTYDPVWDEPPVFLAHRALQRGALEEAEEMVRSVGTAPAERIRLVIHAVRQGALSSQDAVELLRYLDAPPSTEAARALDRIARAAPGLPVPREALAWMLLKAGKYEAAGKHFTALAAARLAPAVRSSVMLGLGCVAHAQQGGGRPEARLRAAVQAGDGAGAADSAEPVTAASRLSSSGLGAPEGGAVFSGKLSVFAVPDLLEFLRGARRTGLLLFSASGGTAALRFREGRITGAASPATPGIGELLVRARKLSAVVLQSILARRTTSEARTDGVLGEVLVREGRVEVDDVKRALSEQIGLAIREVLEWRDGEFAFNREEPGEEAEITVEVDPQEILLNVLKDMDEAARSRVLS